jgi:hypothetical protein
MISNLPYRRVNLPVRMAASGRFAVKNIRGASPAIQKKLFWEAMLSPQQYWRWRPLIMVFKLLLCGLHYGFCHPVRDTLTFPQNSTETRQTFQA